MRRSAPGRGEGEGHPPTCLPLRPSPAPKGALRRRRAGRSQPGDGADGALCGRGRQVHRQRRRRRRVLPHGRGPGGPAAGCAGCWCLLAPGGGARVTRVGPGPTAPAQGGWLRRGMPCRGRGGACRGRTRLCGRLAAQSPCSATSAPRRRLQGGGLHHRRGQGGAAHELPGVTRAAPRPARVSRRRKWRAAAAAVVAGRRACVCGGAARRAACAGWLRCGALHGMAHACQLPKTRMRSHLGV